jgi:transcriptional regulator with XRE-family HTH domain
LKKALDFFCWFVILYTMKDRIVELRKILDLNQTEFAKRLCITSATISSIELGKSKLTDRTIKAICDTFGVSELWLRTGKGEIMNEEARLSEYERRLLVLFRQLLPQCQKMVIDYTEFILENTLKIGSIEEKTVQTPPPERGDAPGGFPLEPRRPAGDPSGFEEERTVG